MRIVRIDANAPLLRAHPYIGIAVITTAAGGGFLKMPLLLGAVLLGQVVSKTRSSSAR